jgi:LysM repeat protein
MNVAPNWIKGLIFTSFLLASIWSLHAQGYVGTIKKDKAIIAVSSAGYVSIDALAKVWGVSGTEVLDQNPGLTAGSIPENATVYIPVELIIRTENCDSCKPVYHQVAKSEGLYRIGKCYGNTSAATLKKMNQLRSDALQPGQELLVGYIASHTNRTLGQHTDGAAGTKEIESAGNKAPVVPEKAAVVEEPKHELSYQGGGIFESEFTPDTPQIARKQGKASSFKSESGWKDGRFYLLCSQLKTGIVVKIIHPVSGKSIYAKVVGPLPKIKQNDKLDWRLSSAASASLGIWDEDEVIDLVLEY